MRRRSQVTAQPVHGRRDRDHRDPPVLLRGVHEVRQPVREPVHGPRGVRERQRPASRLARADRGRQRRQGAERLAGLGLPAEGLERPAAAVLGRRRDDDDLRQRTAGPQGRDLLDPPADLPRGQLLHRRPPRHARVPGRAERIRVPDPAGHRAGPVRPAPHIASERHPLQPPDPAAGVRPGGQAGRPRVQRVDPVLDAGVPVRGRGRPRHARNADPRPVELGRQGRRSSTAP